MLSKECSRIDELARESEGKQAKGKASFFCVLLYGLPLVGVAQIWAEVFLLKGSDQQNSS